MKIAILASPKSEWENLAAMLRNCFDSEKLSVNRCGLDEPMYHPPKPDTLAVFAMVDGMEALTAVRKIADWNTDTSLVLVCKNPDYALEGIRLNVLHYLLEPLTQTDVSEAVDRVRTKKKGG